MRDTYGWKIVRTYLGTLLFVVGWNIWRVCTATMTWSDVGLSVSILSIILVLSFLVTLAVGRLYVGKGYLKKEETLKGTLITIHLVALAMIAVVLFMIKPLITI